MRDVVGALLPSMFRWDWEPRPEWQETLDKLSPPSTRRELSWYLIRWEAGELWRPIQRWVIWQMHPYGKRPKHLHPRALTVHPRSTGHACFEGWCACAEPERRWVGGPDVSEGVDRVTYELYHETGCYGQRFWVIQGTRGGHRRRYDEIETAVAMAMGLEGEPPVMGSLPYASPDERTWRALYEADRLYQGKDLIDRIKRNPKAALVEDRQRAEDCMRQIGEYIDRQVEEKADHVYSALRRTTDHEVSRATVEQCRINEVNPEAMEQRFLEGGSF